MSREERTAFFWLGVFAGVLMTIAALVGVAVVVVPLEERALIRGADQARTAVDNVLIVPWRDMNCYCVCREN